MRQVTYTDVMETAPTEVHGYYTVYMNLNGQKIPYVVFAQSDYHAARLVREETGYMAFARDVEGPFRRN